MPAFAGRTSTARNLSLTLSGQVDRLSHPVKLFEWQGMNQHQRGKVVARDVYHAKVLLAIQGIRVKRIKRHSGWWQWLAQMKPGNKIYYRDITTLLHQLAVILGAGVDLITALTMLSNHQHKTVLKELLLAVIHSLQQGESLARSFAPHARYVDALSRQFIAIGEQIGALDAMLKRAAEHRNSIENLRKKLIMACLYPGMVLTLALIITAALLIFVVPKFSQLFMENNIALPFLTQCVIGISHYVRAYALLSLFVMILVLTLFFLMKKFSKIFSIYVDFMVIKLPIMGNFLRKLIQARCLKTLAIMLAAGLPLSDSLIATANVAHNRVFRWGFLQIKDKTCEGQALHVSMQATAIFSPLVVQMVESGENSGNLDHMLHQLAEFYEDETTVFITYLHHLLEPIVMMVLGVVIGVLLIALYVPIFQLGTLI